MREIKFRFWDNENNCFWDNPINLLDLVFNYGMNYSDAGKDEHRIVYAGQYTGLKDKNAKEIYEGDILTFKNSMVGVVEYEGGGFAIRYGQFDYYDLIQREPICVIGNIYENPCLIK